MEASFKIPSSLLFDQNLNLKAAKHEDEKDERKGAIFLRGDEATYVSM